MLREWNGELRILSMLLFADAQGRAVRSLGSTIYLRATTSDGEVVPSLHELDATIAGLTDVRARIASGDPALMAQIADVHEAREAWARERERTSGGSTR